MPNRIIRGGWVDSDAVNTLSCEAERFFLRLCLNADDVGRLDGRPALLKSRLFPLKEKVGNADIAAWLAECQQAGLVRPYEVDSKDYVVIPKFNQVLRIKKARFPKPPWPPGNGRLANICLTPEEQMAGKCIADDKQMPCTCAPEVEEEEKKNPETEGERKGTPAPPHIPSVSEVEEYGNMHGVPADFCRHYHAVCSEKHRWLVGPPGRERLLGWPSELKRWWEKDRITWKNPKPQNPNPKTAGSREIPEQINVKRL